MGPAQRLTNRPRPAATGGAVGTWLEVVELLLLGAEGRAEDGGRRLAVAALLGVEGQRRPGGSQQPLGKAAA